MCGIMMFVNEQKQHMEKKMAIEVFNRYEKKYRIRDDTYYKLRERLSEYMEADEHSKDGDFYTICNIYYDTPDNYLIRKSIDGSVYKEKLRLRSYGVKAPDEKVFLEIILMLGKNHLGINHLAR